MRNINETTADLGQDTLSGKYLTFLIGKELYGIDISCVTEIVGIQAITVMPNMPDYIKGIINLRGIIVPLIDIRLRFTMESKEYDDRTCVIVVDFEGTSVGLIVDSVSEVIDLPPVSIVELPQNSMGLSSKYIKNIGKLDSNVILLLDSKKLLTTDEFESLGQSM